MHTIGMMKVWLFSPPKKKMGRGELGKKILAFSQECFIHVHVIQIYWSQKKGEL